MTDKEESTEKVEFSPELTEAIKKNAIAARLLEEDVKEGIPTLLMITLLLGDEAERIKFLDNATTAYVEASNKIRIIGEELSLIMKSEPLSSGSDRFLDICNKINNIDFGG